MIEQIDHVNLVVQDLERMVAFYRDALQLQVTKQVSISGDWIDRVVGLRGARADVVYLQAPTGPRVELIRYHHPPAPDSPERSQPHAPGLRHLAFRVQDIDERVAVLRQQAVEFISDVQQVPDQQVTYAGGVRKRLVYFLDPEGNLLEFCEYR